MSTPPARLVRGADQVVELFCCQQRLKTDTPFEMMAAFWSSFETQRGICGNSVIEQAWVETEANRRHRSAAAHALAAQNAVNMSPTGVMLAVDNKRRINAHGAVTFAPFIPTQMFTTEGRRSPTYETFLRNRCN